MGSMPLAPALCGNKGVGRSVEGLLSGRAAPDNQVRGRHRLQLAARPHSAGVSGALASTAVPGTGKALRAHDSAAEGAVTQQQATPGGEPAWEDRAHKLRQLG